MTQIQRRAYGIGKDAAAEGLTRRQLDNLIDWAVSEGIVPDTYEVDVYARMGYVAKEMVA